MCEFSRGRNPRTQQQSSSQPAPPMQTRHFLDIPDHFNFKSTIYSHGWCGLLPFEIDEKKWTLSYVFGGKNGDVPIAATISEENGKLKVETDRGTTNIDNLLRDVRHLLRIEEDLDGLYRSIEKKPGLEWVLEKCAGRLLRSPTVFEDLVKTICTTNCSWALTKNMVTNLVKKLGSKSESPSSGGGTDAAAKAPSFYINKHAFPTPDAMASAGVEFYRDEIGLFCRARRSRGLRPARS